MARPGIPIDALVLKQILRAGLDSQTSRSFWWPILPSLRMRETTVIDSDLDTVGSAERLRDLLNEPLLDPQGSVFNPREREADYIESVATKLYSVLVSQRKVSESDANYWMSLVRIVVWQVRRVDVCYWMISNIMDQPERYFSPTPASLHVIFYSFREMLRSFMPHTYSALKTIGALEDKYLSVLFVDLFVEIFPPHLLLPLLDAYLMEGVKVLYRYALALIVGYKGAVKEGRFATAKEFWLAVKSDGVAVAQAANTSMCCRTLGIEEVMQVADAFMVNDRARNQTYFLSGKLKENAYEVGRSVLSRIARPMNVSRTNIKALEVAASLVEDTDVRKTVSRRLSTRSASSSSPVKSVTEKFLDNSSNSPLARLKARPSLSPPNHTANHGNSGQNSPVVSKTYVAVRGESDKTNSAEDTSSSSDSQLALTTRVAELVEQSELLSTSQATALLSVLPESMSSEGLSLCFASYRDGHALSTLYAQCAALSPVLLLCQPAARLNGPPNGSPNGPPNGSPNGPPEDGADGSTEAVLPLYGAVLRDSLSPPDRERVRGEGRGTRVFRIAPDDGKHGKTEILALEWAALRSDALQERLRKMAEDGDSVDIAERAGLSAVQQWCVAAHESLSFGASRAHGTHALRVDGALRTLSLGASDTFANTLPLSELSCDPSERGRQAAGESERETAWLLRDVEVFCGAAALARAQREGRIGKRESALPGGDY